VRVSGRKQPPGLFSDRRETSSGRTPRATSVATRRSAACSSASRARAVRLSVFAIAVATSSVKEARRASVSAGSGCSSWPLNATTMHPHSRLSALTGTPTEDRRPQSWEATWPITPETSL
jgi:hypothetical protein